MQYSTIKASSQAKLVIRKSTFLSFVLSTDNVEEAEDKIKEYRKTYYDARHVCFAYILCPDSSAERSSDAGEPSGTAGRPILGAIRSAGLTNVLVIVVRYFGGIKLGTSGLIAAYRQAAELAIQKAETVVCITKSTYNLQFPYSQLSAVLQVLGKQDVHIINTEISVSDFCHILIDLPDDSFPSLNNCLVKIPKLTLSKLNAQ